MPITQYSERGSLFLDKASLARLQQVSWRHLAEVCELQGGVKPGRRFVLKRYNTMRSSRISPIDRAAMQRAFQQGRDADRAAGWDTAAFAAGAGVPHDCNQQ